VAPPPFAVAAVAAFPTAVSAGVSVVAGCCYNYYDYGDPCASVVGAVAVVAIVLLSLLLIEFEFCVSPSVAKLWL